MQSMSRLASVVSEPFSELSTTVSWGVHWENRLPGALKAVKEFQEEEEEEEDEDYYVAVKYN